MVHSSWDICPIHQTAIIWKRCKESSDPKRLRESNLSAALGQVAPIGTIVKPEK
jgi:hypothetical protein